MLGCLSSIALVATAVAAGLGYFSFWWTLVPAFVAGSFALSNGPYYSHVIEANRQGRLGVFPMALAIAVGSALATAGIVYLIAAALSSI